MDVQVIEPGHGSTWLSDARFEGEFVAGEAWDDSSVGSGLMPDDFRGEPVTLAFPRRLILRTRE